MSTLLLLMLLIAQQSARCDVPYVSTKPVPGSFNFSDRRKTRHRFLQAQMIMEA